MQLGHLQTTDHKYYFANVHYHVPCQLLQIMFYLCSTTSLDTLQTETKQMHRALSTPSQNEEFCDILCYIFLVLVVNPGLPAKNTRFRVPRRKYWALGFHYKDVDSITIILVSRDPPPLWERIHPGTVVISSSFVVSQ